MAAVTMSLPSGAAAASLMNTSANSHLQAPRWLFEFNQSIQACTFLMSSGRMHQGLFKLCHLSSLDHRGEKCQKISVGTAAGQLSDKLADS